MATLPPVVMEIKANAAHFMAAVAEATDAVKSLTPSDYQIRRDALTLTVTHLRNPDAPPAVFEEWSNFFEAALRGTAK